MGKKQDETMAEGMPAQRGIVAIAAYFAGAATRNVDMEDIAVKANELAPGRFSWKKYKNQIDLELIYKHLWDLTKPENGAHITGSKKAGWMLTLAGTSFAEKTSKSIEGLNLSKVRMTSTDKERLKRDRVRMLSEPAYIKFAEGRGDQITIAEAERLFRLDDYVVGDKRELKLIQIENAFHDEPKLGSAVAHAAKLVRSKK